MLNFKNVTVKHQDGKLALIDFDLHVKQGEIVILVGESGSGKTTAIRSALGLISGAGEITRGEIFLQGKSLKNLSNREWQKIRGEEMSMIFQDAGSMLNPIRKIGSQFTEYICFHKKIEKKEAWNLASQMLLNMGLGHHEAVMQSYPFQLSGGMRQRVGIAMAMVFKSKLILADEPTSALDVTIQSQIVKQLMELRDDFGTTIVMTTHNLGVAAYMADRIVVMQDGKIVEVGTRDEIIFNPKCEYTKELIKAVPNKEDNLYV